MSIGTLEFIERDRQRCFQARQIRQQEVLAMALKSKPRPKQQGFPIGGSFDAIADRMGNMKIKPKRKPPGQTLNQQYVSKNRKKWRAAK